MFVGILTSIRNGNNILVICQLVDFPMCVYHYLLLLHSRLVQMTYFHIKTKHPNNVFLTQRYIFAELKTDVFNLKIAFNYVICAF